MTRLWVKEMLRKKHEDHAKRIQEIKPTVDNKRSKEPKILRDRSLERRHRHEIIEQENRKIIDRIGRAMEYQLIDNTPPAFTSSPSSTTVKSNSPSKINKARGKLSLNEVEKKKELRRITKDNNLMLNRIRTVESVYNRVEWEKEFLDKQRYLKAIAEFPPPVRTASPLSRSANINSRKSRGRLEPLDYQSIEIPNNPWISLENNNASYDIQLDKSIIRKFSNPAVRKDSKINNNINKESNQAVNQDDNIYDNRLLENNQSTNNKYDANSVASYNTDQDSILVNDTLNADYHKLLASSTTSNESDEDIMKYLK